MCFNSFCESCRRLRRIVRHNVEKTSYRLIFSFILLFVIFPTTFIALACCYPKDRYVRNTAIFYNIVIVVVAIKIFIIPVKNAMAETKGIAFIDSADVEASSDNTSGITLTPEGVSWGRYPHWPLPSTWDTLIKESRRYHPDTPPPPAAAAAAATAAAAETSAARNVEDSDVESNPHVTHRSRHPSKLSEEQKTPSHTETKAEVYRSNSEENE